jgi:hypothetical protein
MRPRTRLELVILLAVVAVVSLAMWAVLIRIFDPSSDHPSVTITYKQEPSR